MLAVRLIAAAEAHSAETEKSGAPPPSDTEAQVLARCREVLEPEAYSAARDIGNAMALDEVVAVAERIASTPV